MFLLFGQIKRREKRDICWFLRQKTRTLHAISNAYFSVNEKPLQFHTEHAFTLPTTFLFVIIL